MSKTGRRRERRVSMGMRRRNKERRNKRRKRRRWTRISIGMRSKIRGGGIKEEENEKKG